MRIRGIGPPTSPRYSPYTQERVWLVMRNNEASAQCDRGGCPIFDTGGTTYTDDGGTDRLFGYDFKQPVTNELVYAMGAAQDDIPATEFGEIQCYGYDDDVLVEGTTGTELLDHAVPQNASFSRKAVAVIAAPGDACSIVEATANLPANGVDGNIACLLGYMGPLAAFA